MNFSSTEKIATLAMLKAMMLADGVIDKREKELMFVVIGKLQPTDAEATISDSMELSVASEIICNATLEKKKIICSLLVVMMSIDLDLDPKEQLLWVLLTRTCGLPDMSVADASDYVADFLKQ